MKLSLTDEELERLRSKSGSPACWGRMSPPLRELYVVRFSEVPEVSIEKCAKRLGLSRAACEGRWRRLRKLIDQSPAREQANLPASVTAPGDVSKLSTVQKIEHAMHRIADGFDAARIAEAKIHQLSAAMRDLNGVRAQLKGEPTQRVQIEAVGPALAGAFAELAHRGALDLLPDDVKAEIREAIEVKAEALP